MHSRYGVIITLAISGRERSVSCTGLRRERGGAEKLYAGRDDLTVLPLSILIENWAESSAATKQRSMVEGVDEAVRKANAEVAERKTLK